MDENTIIPAALYDEPKEGPEISKSLNDFVEKYRGALTMIVSIAMIALIVYLILNIQYIKMNPLEYCEKALNSSGCYCMP